MKPNLDQWTLVIVGNWNRHILSPQWVSKYIFQEDSMEIEMPMNPFLPPRYTSKSKKIRLIPTEDRVILNALVDNDECLSLVEATAMKLLEILSHTPITAFGINFGFVGKLDELNSESIKGSDLFGIKDGTNLSNAGCRISNTAIVRQINYAENILNLKLTHTEQGTVGIDLNFHYGVNNGIDAVGKLKGQVVKCKSEAYALIKKVYDIDAEQPSGEVVSQ